MATTDGPAVDSVPCPSFRETERTVCWANRDDAVVYVQPSTQTFEIVSEDDTVETIEFTLHNEADYPFQCNPHDWILKKRTGDGWVHVAPQGPVKEPQQEAQPAGAYTWSLSRQTHPSPSDDVQQITAPIEDGIHAFSIKGSYNEAYSSFECLALFDIKTLTSE